MMLAQLPLPYPFELEFMQRALVAGVVVGAFAPMIGTFLVLRRMSLIGDGIGHIAFAGFALGVVIASSVAGMTGVDPLWMALAVAVAGALGLEQLRARRKASGDLALALFFYSGIALGVVLLSRAKAPNSTNAAAILFGQILSVSDTDVVRIVILGAVVGAGILAVRRTLFAVVADEEWARVAGLPVAFMNNLLAVITAITVVASIPVVGILLIAGLMVLPVASAQLLARSFRGTMIWATSIGIGSVVIGLIASRVWNLASGGTIILVAAGAFAVVAVASRSRSRWRFFGGAERGAAPPIGAATRSGRGILADSHFADRLGGDGQ